VLRLCHGLGLFEVRSPATEGAPVLLTLRLESVEDLGEAVQTVRGSLDLDANPSAVLSTLGRDPLLGPIVEKNPGRRVPGHVNGDEMAIRAILGQQVSVSAARTHTARLVALLGTPLNHPVGTLRFAFPTPEQIVAAGPELPGMALVGSRRRTVYGFAAARQAGDVPPLRRGGDPDRIGRALERVFGIGPWTRAYVALRALGDPDAFLASDLGVRQSLAQLAGRPVTARESERLSEPWRPFRGYAVVHLWAALAQTARQPPSG
jgi:AraC family transcriptional regulator of adaptative response / DNA-3-methyladenine glycosylase II